VAVPPRIGHTPILHSQYRQRSCPGLAASSLWAAPLWATIIRLLTARIHDGVRKR